MSEKINLREAMAKISQINKRDYALPTELYAASLLMKEAVRTGRDLNDTIEYLREAEASVERHLANKELCHKRLDILEEELNKMLTPEQLETLFKKFGVN